MTNNNLPQNNHVEQLRDMVRCQEAGRYTWNDICREAIQVPAVVQVLNRAEVIILEASCKVPLHAMPSEAAGVSAANVIRTAASDIGAPMPDAEQLRRMVKVLRTTYGNFTVADVNAAFGLTLTGEMDEHFPANYSGGPDKAHFRAMNIEYLCKVMNAYRKMRGAMLKKVVTKAN